MKLKLILAMLLPTMRMGVKALRDKDENSTGADDIVANQLEATLKGLEEYVITEGIRSIETVEEMLNYLNDVVKHDPNELKAKINYSMEGAQTKRALSIPLVELGKSGITFMISDAK